MWSYTLPSDRSVEILNEAGYPLFTNARRLRAHHARDGGLPGAARAPADAGARPSPLRSRTAPARARCLAAAGAVLCEWQARPLLAAYGIGGGDAGTLAHSAAEAEAAARAYGAAGGAQGAIRRYSAQDRSRRGGAQYFR